MLIELIKKIKMWKVDKKLDIKCNLRSEECSQFERFCLQLTQIVNKTPSFKIKLISNNAKVSRVNHSTLWCFTFQPSKQLPVTNYCSANSGQRGWHPPFNITPFYVEKIHVLLNCWKQVFEGVLLLKAWQALPMAGEAIEK